ncbi:acyl-CoA dehydrogenase C-terminal domain-containing protein [Parahaliea aestuarii]|uniref:3-methylmercaptopropionyl-CoA dehydrogenase n=1 Tax=Parahaliea aestuarii TaxID=1852021 RepID=A0A5C9A0T6_9GAMM|nr:acyl-CoA dehydrogenase C-terminal domain-containing protein [Parahaliea aestuarii]TXS94376.1 acyl-CoA dehydrogenase [Parahaliea aestuarii]
MPSYTAPRRDIQFVLREFLDADTHYSKLQLDNELSPDLLDAILDGGAKFAEDVVAPLYQSGDAEGCTFRDGKVTTPTGYAEAFRQWGEGGWQGLTVPVADGGQGLPASVSMCVGEMVGSANWAWNMYTGLSLAPVTCLLNGGTEALKARFLPKILSGEWAGTMCLTEAHCGSDVGLLRTRASDNGDGTWTVTGSKIFISGGEQDITENIVHAILARTEGAPEGTAGISLFIVPKFWVEEDGSLGEFNNVNCGAIERKMGLKSSATCVMNYDGARGFMLGEENRGLQLMFKLMNSARIGTAMQGLAMSERAFQGALAYARERLQMRSLTGAKNPDGPADPIIVHPDVRRMLMTQKAFTEGGRAFIYWLAQQVDLTSHGSEEEAATASELLELLTPIAKGFCTESAQEVAYLGMQVFGGHGYIAEHGMEQVARDNRIATVYEGTTGIQSLDLVGRKVLGSGGKLLRNFTRVIHKYCEAHSGNSAMAEFLAPLAEVNREWGELTMKVGEAAMADAEVVGSASVDYLMFSGYVTYAWVWARIAETSLAALQRGEGDEGFYRAKLATARFYFQRLLPRARAHAAAALAPASSVMALGEDEFAF